MNYAQDALWWRLSDPHVRALASLITAPPLWHSGCELPVKTLLGECGFRFLLHLDHHPHTLHQTLAEYPQKRMGKYAEQLLAYWFRHAPHNRFIAHNWTCTQEQQQREIDFIVEINKQIYHIELTCKYYYLDQHQQLRGFNPQDTLTHKQHTLQKQLQLSQSEAFHHWLDKNHITQTIQAASIVRGMVFGWTANIDVPKLNPHAWQGQIIDISELQKTDWLIYPLKPMEYLAPAQKPHQTCVRASEYTAKKPTLLAQMQEYPNGIWREIARWCIP